MRIFFTFIFITILSITGTAQDSLVINPIDTTASTDASTGLNTILKDTNNVEEGKVILKKVKRSESLKEKGNVRVIQDERINTLDQIIKEQPYEHDGYRIQILFGSKAVVNNKRASFESKFSYRTYVDWLPPNFRLRVGNFPTKQLAEKHIYRIRKSYPNSYIVKDKISTPSAYK